MTFSRPQFEVCFMEGNFSSSSLPHRRSSALAVIGDRRLPQHLLVGKGWKNKCHRRFAWWLESMTVRGPNFSHCCCLAYATSTAATMSTTSATFSGCCSRLRYAIGYGGDLWRKWTTENEGGTVRVAEVDCGRRASKSCDCSFEKTRKCRPLNKHGRTMAISAHACVGVVPARLSLRFEGQWPPRIAVCN